MENVRTSGRQKSGRISQIFIFSQLFRNYVLGRCVFLTAYSLSFWEWSCFNANESVVIAYVSVIPYVLRIPVLLNDENTQGILCMVTIMFTKSDTYINTSLEAEAIMWQKFGGRDHPKFYRDNEFGGRKIFCRALGLTCLHGI